MSNSPPSNFFVANAPIYVARAPGRLDVMGGIADYSGSLVLQLPIDRHTVAMLQLHDEPTIDITSKRDGRDSHVALSLDEFLRSTPDSLRALYANDNSNHWATYVLGVAHACLVRNATRVRRPAQGFSVFIESTVPEGKGVSSSAALEVSSLAVIASAFDVELSAEEIAHASQWAENHVAGAPCGIMDQMTSACGRRDHLLRLRCQPASIEGHVAIPTGFRFYGIDSGIRHAVTGADYGTVRTAAFMGYRIIASIEGLAASRAGDRVHVHDDRWHGYLANISPDHFTTHLEHHLPEQLLGAEFLARFDGITDDVTRVSPDRVYPVRQATAHPVHENARVERFASLLASLEHTPSVATEMGDLMRASHASYSACGLGSDGTDRLVAMVAERKLFGAKITGGGSGGTVAVFARAEDEPIVREIASAHEQETGRKAEVFSGSGAGMAEIGVMKTTV